MNWYGLYRLQQITLFSIFFSRSSFSLSDFDTSTTSDTDESTTDNDQKNIGNTTETLRQLDRRTIEDSDDEYDYYNPKDKRLWKEKE